MNPTNVALACFFISAAALAAQNVEFRQTSVPAGVIDETTYPLPGEEVTTLLAPWTSGTYRFVYWTLDGVRVDNASGTGANPVRFTITGPAAAVAHYQLEAEDSDGDGLPDWFEIHHFGDLSESAADDHDADGFTNGQELESGTHPGVNNLRAQGGLSRRRFVHLLTADVGGTDPAHPYGGLSRRRGNAGHVLVAPGLAVLRERTDPEGVFDEQRVVPVPSTVLLREAPLTYSGYRYTGWLVDGVRVDTPPKNQPVALALGGPTTAVARYVQEALDSDADGIPDWMELLDFNNLENDLESDPDGDGLPWSVEQFRGYSVVAADDLAPGGLSRRRSAAQAVDVSGTRVVWKQTSLPQTLVDSSELVEIGTTVSTSDRGGQVLSGYHFAFWDLNGSRMEDPSGAALGGFSLEIAQNSTATAHFFQPDADSDGDGISDLDESIYYGDLAQGPADDTDEDGLDYGVENRRGYSPRAVDTIMDGGLSRRRTPETAVNAILLDLPPALTTPAVIGIRSTSATLTALVNPIGSPTDVRFEWGLTNGYGNATGVQAIGSGLLALRIEAELSGLEPDTEYHIRVVAENEEGITTSQDVTFRTLRWNWDRWSAARGIVSITDDTDGDGVDALLEMIFGMDPAIWDADLLPQPERMGRRWRMRADVATDRDGFVLKAAYSTDLTDWHDDMANSGTPPSYEFWTPEELETNKLFVRWLAELE